MTGVRGSYRPPVSHAFAGITGSAGPAPSPLYGLRGAVHAGVGRAPSAVGVRGGVQAGAPTARGVRGGVQAGAPTARGVTGAVMAPRINPAQVGREARQILAHGGLAGALRGVTGAAGPGGPSFRGIEGAVGPGRPDLSGITGSYGPHPRGGILGALEGFGRTLQSGIRDLPPFAGESGMQILTGDVSLGPEPKPTILGRNRAGGLIEMRNPAFDRYLERKNAPKETGIVLPPFFGGLAGEAGLGASLASRAALGGVTRAGALRTLGLGSLAAGAAVPVKRGEGALGKSGGELTSIAEFPYIAGFNLAKAGVESAAHRNIAPLKHLASSFAQGATHGALGELLQGNPAAAWKAAKEHRVMTAIEAAGLLSAAGRAGGAAIRTAARPAEGIAKAERGFAPKFASDVGPKGFVSGQKVAPAAPPPGAKIGPRITSRVRPPIGHVNDAGAVRLADNREQRRYSGDATRQAMQMAADRRRTPIVDEQGKPV